LREDIGMSVRRTQSVFVVAPLVLALAACGGAPASDTVAVAASSDYPVSLDNCGVASSVSQMPARAITMNQGATEVMLALGLQAQLAGTAYLDDAVPQKWKVAYDSVEVLSPEYPDHETILDTRPDFIYASYVGAFDKGVAGTPKDLADLGIGSYTSPLGCADAARRSEVSFDTVWDEVDTVAEVFAVPDRAAQIRADQEQLLAMLARQGVGQDTSIFWYDSGDKSAFAGAGEGGPQLIMDTVGATNLFADLDGGWADVSWEKVIDADPDVIVLGDASWSTAEDKIALLKKDPVLRKMTAVRDEQFVVLPFSESTPGVRLADGAQTVADGLAALDRN